MKKKFIIESRTALILILFLLLSSTVMATVLPHEMGQRFIFPEDIMPQSYQSYQVRGGDSLFSIAQRFGISLVELRQANNLWTDSIRIGQRLNIPVNDADYVFYRVQAGDTLSRIARTFNIALSEIRRANNIWNDNIEVGQELTIPQVMNQQRSYTVQRGDTLFRIASRFGITVAELSNVNDLSLGYIWPGQVLTIPSNNRNFNPTRETIVVDAGHGGRDPGAVTHYNSQLIKESDIVLDISKRLVNLLEQAGFNVIETRTGDYALSLWQRVQASYQNNADLFVSVHTDNSPNFPWTGGSNVYIQPGADWNTFQVAETVQRNLEQITGRPTNSLGRVLRRRFTVVMQSRPAILVETGFLSNQRDIRGFQTPEFRQTIAQGIFNGIVEWIN
ncbi:N-acetylmuramoyl-L-alanine amidase family protein [Natronospora cellulosivora (SeqCode)]